LDWSTKITIVNGIAKGLLYLHEDSRLRIIHRDLKASNVLLDKDMNPKISDFGMARIFGGDQIEANTNGYMSPEYAIDGLFSMKSDVYSFGVLMLEIISGNKNRGFSHKDHNLNLLGHGWKLWMEGRPIELAGNVMDEPSIITEVVRCIHVGLLCVQQKPDDRPSMSSVVVMLSSDILLPQPKQPGFFTERNVPATEFSSDKINTSEVPVTERVGVFNITSQGNLTLVDATQTLVWSSNSSRFLQSPIVKLLDSGNLVVKDGNDKNPENYLWQNFDYPCDTLLPGMKTGIVNSLNKPLTSWKSAEDPGNGEFSLKIYSQGYPQGYVKNGNRTLFRIGSWNGERFTGIPTLKQSSTFTYEFVLNENEMYFKFETTDGSALPKYTIYPSGLLQHYTWNDQTNDWMVLATTQVDQCENYALCGTYAGCYIYNSPICSCLEGFAPKSPTDWNLTKWSDGCIRRTPLGCNRNDGFPKYKGIKVPDTSSSSYTRSISLAECAGLCLNNCSCTAYASLEIRNGGSGCLQWFADLIDMRGLAEGGQDLYVKVAAYQFKKTDTSQEKKKRIIISISVTLLVLVMVTLTVCCFTKRRRKLRMEDHTKEEIDLPIFDLDTVVDATNNFSNSKLGEGGFGPVYKGTLPEGQGIAVKRLSKSFGQGLNEFKNEFILFSKLQHHNLVKLLGCCISEDEKMLIYEYMPNKSLDSIIFDKSRSKQLDWYKRVEIIDGIARGLLYLHQDSRLRIIHRDLKASNILLDNDMKPKISDFGLAKTFGADQTEAKTTRVVGTHGYMSPEYVADGKYSMKSDIFSFGVLVLEIVSGKRNRGFHHPSNDLNLVGHAWTLWKEGSVLETVDECLRESCKDSQAIVRYIQVALLCVQQRPEDRPNMSSVVLMLGSVDPLPQPKQPGFFVARNPYDVRDDSLTEKESQSVNEVTMTVLEAR
ncbi:G-type lectin S-receptor-like serine/threonine-protein kinase At4g27290, partial [Linum grandiflorum]